MAETRSGDEERALPSKRKPDLTSPDADEAPPAKAPKSGYAINGDSHSDGGVTIVQTEENGAEKAEVPDAPGRAGAEEEVHGYDFGEDDEEDDEDYVTDEEDGEQVVDVKGKGVLRYDKGKGKLVVGEDDEGEDDSGSDDSDDTTDSSDSDDGDVQSGSDSEWADDPLAEVDLDNILPSRTRRRRPLPGVIIAADGRNSDGDSST